VIPERKERIGIEAGPAALIGRVGVPLERAQAIVTGPRRLLLGLLFLKVPVAQLEAAGAQDRG
jgi:hypothetical protein